LSRRVCAIDIGSNAIRMMIADVSPQQEHFHIVKKYRAAVRLGHDAFTLKSFTPQTIELALEAFRRFAKTNRDLQVKEVRAVATSACRESRNSQVLVDRVYTESGIKIEIIDGLEEGRLIHQAVQHELELKNKTSMLIDIGGGSVEVTFSQGDQILSSKSFPMGTVRVLENLQKRNLTEAHMNILIGEFLPELTKHIHRTTEETAPDFAVGTGGNIECLGQLKEQLLKRSPSTFLTLAELSQIIDILKSTRLKDRIEKLRLRPDRADVIIPASTLVQTIMRQAETEKILIPKVGLRDGLIWAMAATI